MRVLWFEFLLALKRLARRRTQNGLMLVTFTVSVALSLLSWSLFRNVFLSNPDFDPQGEYLVMTCAGGKAGVMKHFTVAEMAAVKEGQKVFADFAEVGFYSSVFIRTPDGAERSLTAYMSSRALQLTEAKPLLGRLFTLEEDKYRSAPAALLSQRMWENSYGSDPDIVGKTVEVTGDPFTIVGVLPKEYKFPNDQDLWLSIGATGDGNQQKWPVRDALVKLKPGVTRDRAERDLQVILTGLGPESPVNKNELRPVLQPFRDVYLQADIKVSALILFGLSLLFVAVSCANAANLMLVDFLGRRAEVAAAMALGVPRGAAVRGVVFQTSVIAAGAAVLSIAWLPIAGPLLYRGIQINNGPYWIRYTFEWHDVGIALALAAVSALVTLIAPIAYLLWVDPDRVIRDHAYASRGTGRGLWRRILLTGQIALLTVLGVSSGLLVRSSYQVGETHWGYDAGRVFLGKISAQAIDYGKSSWSQGRLVTHLKMLEQVKQRPETVAAAIADEAPGYSRPPNCAYALNPAAFGDKAELGEATSSRVTEGYFETLGVPLVAGETFPREMADDAPDYAVINESLARKLWPGQDPLQRTLYIRSRDPWMKEDAQPRRVIVQGVARDFQASGPLAKNNDFIFTPYRAKVGTGSALFIFVRDRAGLASFRALNDVVHRAEPRVSLYFPSTIGTQIDIGLSSVRLTAHLTTLFAAAAVLLCAIGVYSLTVAQVLQSSREFGIRMALGAEPGRLWVGFTRGHLLTALVGVALGLAGASQVVRVLGSLLYGVDPYSVATYAGVAAAILVVAVLACVPSLWRLRRINPADCLRSL